MSKTRELVRCPWPKFALDIAYHDSEWGVPAHDDALLFEHLFLDTMQAGLSWSLILRKRETFRAAFDGFDPREIVRYDERRAEKLLQDPGIIRNRLKVRAAITNSRAFLDVQQEFGSFDTYIWRFTGGRTLQHRHRTMAEVPALTPESDAMSRDLYQRGFKFVGPTICYAFMQATGMVNDHLVDCFRHQTLR